MAAATAAVARPTASEVTDGDVLSALLERDAVSREQLVQALALCTLKSTAAAGAGEAKQEEAQQQ